MKIKDKKFKNFSVCQTIANTIYGFIIIKMHEYVKKYNYTEYVRVYGTFLPVWGVGRGKKICWPILLSTIFQVDNEAALFGVGGRGYGGGDHYQPTVLLLTRYNLVLLIHRVLLIFIVHQLCVIQIGV